MPLCVDALKAAVHEAKQGVDVGRYKEAWDCIRIAAPNEPEAVRDQEWIDKIDRRNQAEVQRLESELRGYKNNLIKESIRVSTVLAQALEHMLRPRCAHWPFILPWPR